MSGRRHPPAYPGRESKVQEGLSWIRSQVFPNHPEEPAGEDTGRRGFHPDNKPIEPEGRKGGGPSLFKWIIFLLFVGYILVSFFKIPLLTSMGEYLVVEHSPQKSELIVCLMGEPIERGLETADLYEKGLAPLIFLPRETPPDGHALLNEKGIPFPDSRDLLKMILRGSGVPESASITTEDAVDSTFDEAREVLALAQEKGFRSLIIVTSPYHTRRAWLTFREVFKNYQARIIIRPSQYSRFEPAAWWRREKDQEEVILEYQKLLYYTFEFFW